jgi:hypothetical protein
MKANVYENDRNLDVPRDIKAASRKISLAGGILYLLTFVSMPIGFLYSAILKDPNYIVGPGPDTPVIIGGILEIIVALAGIGRMTPAAVHFGQAALLFQNRQAVLQQAYAGHSQRFVKGVPRPPALPVAAWINPPTHIEDRKNLH